MYPAILVVEDDSRMQSLIRSALGAEGYIVKTAETGAEGIQQALSHNVDLIILDIGLPDADGLEIARALRVQSYVPILMLSGRSDVASRIRGLDAGADDYLPKPFDIDELRARVRSILRRSTYNDTSPGESGAIPLFGDCRLDPRSNSVIAPDGRIAKLTGREFLILSTLVRRAGSVVTRDELQRQATGHPWRTDDRSLDVHVHHLRRKLIDLDPSLSMIKTLRNRGFTIEQQDEPDELDYPDEPADEELPVHERKPESTSRQSKAEGCQVA